MKHDMQKNDVQIGHALRSCLVPTNGLIRDLGLAITEVEVSIRRVKVGCMAGSVLRLS